MGYEVSLCVVQAADACVNTQTRRSCDYHMTSTDKSHDGNSDETLRRGAERENWKKYLNQ